jgi:hypothetical protein
MATNPGMTVPATGDAAFRETQPETSPTPPSLPASSATVLNPPSSDPLMAAVVNTGQYSPQMMAARYNAARARRWEWEPDATAEAKRLSDKYRLPMDAVARNLSRVQAMEQQQDAIGASEAIPAIRDWLAADEKGYRAMISRDSIAQLAQVHGITENLGGNVWGSYQETVGTTMRGAGAAVNALERGAAEVGEGFLSRVLRFSHWAQELSNEMKVGNGVRIGRELAYRDINLDPNLPAGREMLDFGKRVQESARGFMTPAEFRTWGQDVIIGLAQMGAQIPLSAMTGGAALYAQGAGIMDEQMEGLGEDVPQSYKDLALLSGAAVTGLTEKFALDTVLGRMGLAKPLIEKVKGRLGQSLARIGLASMSEGGTELTENVLQDAIIKGLVDSNHEIDFGQAAYEGSLGGTVGGLMRAIIEVGMGIRGRQAQGELAGKQVELLGELNKAMKAEKVLKRDPAAFADLMRGVGESNGVSAIYADAQVLNQAGLDARLAELSPSTAEQLPEALETGALIEIPYEEWVSKVAPASDADAFNEYVTTSPDLPSLREATAYAESGAQEILEADLDRALSAVEQQDEFRANATTIADQVTKDLEATGQAVDAPAKLYGQLIGNFYATLAARFGYGATPQSLYNQYKLNIEGAANAGRNPAPNPRAVSTGQPGVPGAQGGRQESPGGSGRGSGEPGVRSGAVGVDDSVGRPAADGELNQALASQPPTGWTHATSGDEARALWNGNGGEAVFWTDLSGGLDTAAPNLAGYSHSINRTFISHAKNSHGDAESEALRGQVAVTENDIARIPEIISDYDAIRTDLTGVNGEQVVAYAKRFDDGVIVYQEGATTKRQNLRGITIWKFQPTVEMDGLLDRVLEKTKARTATASEPSGDALRPLSGYQPDAQTPPPESSIDQSGNALNQGESNAPRGSYDPATLTIRFLQAPDLSTFLHESGHFFLDMSIKLAADMQARIAANPQDSAALTAPQKQFLEDVETALRWGNIDGLAAWQALDFEGQRAFHEQFAEGFEKYLFEGKAPTIELQGMFQRFSAWLKNVYRAIRNIGQSGVDLNPEVRAVFDRMLATEEAIIAQQQYRNMDPMFDTAEEARAAGLSEDAIGRLSFLQREATAQGAESLQSKALRDAAFARKVKARGELKKRIDDARRQFEPQARQIVLSDPVFRAAKWLTDPVEKDERNQKRDPENVETDRDTLFDAIAKLGGLNKAEAVSAWGIDPADKIPAPFFGKPVLRAGDKGLTIDGLGEALAPYGYLTLDENGRYDTEELFQIFDAELRGSPQYSRYYDPSIFEPTYPGKTGGRFSEAGLRGIGADEETIDVLKRRGMVRNDGYPPDMVATALNEYDADAQWTSGMALVRAVASAPSLRAAVDSEIDYYVLQVYGDLTTASGRARYADEAAHNEARIRMAAAEADALTVITGGARGALMAASLEYARRRIGTVKLRLLSSSKYAAAAAASNKAAKERLKSGNVEAAAAKKRQALIQLALAKEAHAFNDELDSSIRNFRRQAKNKAIPHDHRVQINNLMERFFLGGQRDENAPLLNEFLDKLKEEGFVSAGVVPAWISGSDTPRSYRELTVDEFRQLRETINMIATHGRNQQRMFASNKEKRFDTVVKELTEAARKNTAGRDYSGEVTRAKDAKSSLLEYMDKKQRYVTAEACRMSTFCWIADGGKRGIFWETFQRPANEAGNREVEMLRDVNQQLADILGPIFEEIHAAGTPKSRADLTLRNPEISKEEAEKELKGLRGRDLFNMETGLSAQVNSTQSDKIISNAAVGKSEKNGFTRGQHYAVAAKIESLWTHATPAEAREGNKPDDIAKIRRFVAPVVINGEVAYAWMTVKETKPTEKQRRVQGEDAARRIYSVELQELKTLRGMLDGPPPGTGDTSTSARSADEIIASLQAKIEQKEDAPFEPVLGRPMSQTELFMLLLNTGNASNMQRLKDGYGWTPEQIHAVLDGRFSAKAFQGAQKIWRLFESFRPEIAEIETELRGNPPKWVQPATTVWRTKEGGSIVLEGGYFPARYDPRNTSPASPAMAGQSATEALEGSSATRAVRRGFTKARSRIVNKHAILLTEDVIQDGLQEVVHYVTHARFIYDIDRFFRPDPPNSELRRGFSEDDEYAPYRTDDLLNAVKANLGLEFVDMVKRWAADVARGEFATDYDPGGEIATFFRRNAALAPMAFNLMTAVKQLTGFIPAAQKVGLKPLNRAIGELLRDGRRMAREINAKSSFMRNRPKTMQPVFDEIYNRVRVSQGGASGAMQKVLSVAADSNTVMAPIVLMQRVVDLATWQAGYTNALNAGNDEATAIQMADQDVIDSQGSGLLKDRSAIERGRDWQKFFTVFYQYMGTILNMTIADFKTAKTAKEKANAWRRYLWRFWVSASLEVWIVQLLIPDDEDWDFERWMREMFANGIETNLGTIIGVREFAGLAGDIARGGKIYGYEGPAGTRIVSDTGRLAIQVAQGENDKALWRASINLMGDLSGIPTAQINRTLQGADAMIEGETANPAALMFGYREKK